MISGKSFKINGLQKIDRSGSHTPPRPKKGMKEGSE